MPALRLDEVEHVARLARLRLTEDEKTSLTESLNVILQQFEILQGLDTSAVEPMARPLDQHNVLRDDVSRPSLPRDEFLSQAPEGRDEFFVVPRVVDTGD